MAWLSGGRSSRRSVRFIAHELAEYCIGAAMIFSGAHLSGGIEKELILGGSLLFLLNAVTRAPLGAVKVVGRHLHHVLDIIVIAILGAAPFFGFVRHDLGADLVVDSIALLLVFIEQMTRYVDSKAPPGNVVPTRSVPNSTAPTAPTAVATAAGAVGATAGAIAAAMGPATRRSARRLGILSGATRRVIRDQRAQRRSSSRAPEDPN